MITCEQAMTAKEFHHNTRKNADGTCERWRRNGSTQTWKTRPGTFRVPVKHGMYDYSNITEREASIVHAAADCPHKH
jgi:hypothetical protein